MSTALTIDYRLIFALMNGKVSTALRRSLHRSFAKAGINISGDQWDVMLAISQKDICTQQELCRATSLSKPTISRIITSLEDMGIAERRKARVDFRNNYIALTRKGLAVTEQAQAIALRTLKESLRGLSKTDIMIAQQSLNTVLQNLQDTEHRTAIEEAQEHQRRSEESRRVVRRMHGRK